MIGKCPQSLITLIPEYYSFKDKTQIKSDFWSYDIPFFPILQPLRMDPLLRVTFMFALVVFTTARYGE